MGVLSNDPGEAMDSTSHLHIMNPGGEERTNMDDFQPLKVDNLIMNEATVCNSELSDHRFAEGYSEFGCSKKFVCA